MVGKEILGSIKPVVGLTPVSGSADRSGDTIDLQGYEAAMICVQIGTVTGTISLQPQVLESDESNTGFTVVAASDLIGGAFTEVTTSAQSNTVQARAYKGTKRYLRVNEDRSGASTVVTSALVLLGNPRHVPVS